MYTVIGQLTRLATKGIVYVADDEQSCSFCSMKWQDVLPKALSAATGLRLHVIQFECACTAAFSISAVLYTTCKLHSSTIRTSYVPCVLWFWCILHDFVCICTYILPKVLLKIFICMLPPGWPCHWHVCMIPLCSNKKKSLQCVFIRIQVFMHVSYPCHNSWFWAWLFIQGIIYCTVYKADLIQ